MRIILPFLISFFLTPTLLSQSVVVNEYQNDFPADKEWVELLVLEDSDVREWLLSDYTGGGNTGNTLTFSNNALWSDLKAGTIILIKRPDAAGPDASANPSDGLIVVLTNDAAYFSGNPFDIAGSSDALQLKNSDGTHVHGISHGSGNAATLPTPKAHLATGSSISSGTSIGFTNTTAFEHFSDNAYLKHYTTPTPGAGNDADNATFISTLFNAVDEPSISLFAGGLNIESEDTLQFQTTLMGSVSDMVITVSNTGLQQLTISDVTMSSDLFTIHSALSATTLEQFESAEMTIRFAPVTAGMFEAVLEISSNDTTNSPFTIVFSGEGKDPGEPEDIAVVRTNEMDRIVTVAGRVTVTDQFNAPVYIQDYTAAIAVYDGELAKAATMGDSVLVTGPLYEFGATTGVPGSGLLEISGAATTWEIISSGEEIKPLTLTVRDAIETYESQLIRIEYVTIGSSGVFQGNTNYNITDNTGTMQMRIINTTNIVDQEIPSGEVTIIGILGQYRGAYQIQPRFVEDLNITPTTNPGDDTPFSETFEAVTWNIEWFGSDSNGPDDNALQVSNVKTVIETLDADLYALQEIANEGLFYQMVNDMPDFRGFVAPISQTQKMAYVYKTSVIDSIKAGFLKTNWETNSDNPLPWANGRYPYEFKFEITIDGFESLIINAVNIHAKAMGDQDSWKRRTDDSRQLKEFFDSNRANNRVLLLGDYNDEMNGSTYNNQTSPYQNFLNDPDNYLVITKALEDKGFTSYSRYSMLDHITINKELFDYYFEGTESLENPSYITSYLSATSDHYPVYVRFKLDITESIEEQIAKPFSVSLEQNYPNPFNPTTNLVFSLGSAEAVSISVYNMLGQKVANPLSNKVYSRGKHTITFDASELASGSYVYELKTGSGVTMARQMTVIK